MGLSLVWSHVAGFISPVHIWPPTITCYRDQNPQTFCMMSYTVVLLDFHSSEHEEDYQKLQRRRCCLSILFQQTFCYKSLSRWSSIFWILSFFYFFFSTVKLFNLNVSAFFGKKIQTPRRFRQKKKLRKLSHPPMQRGRTSSL